MYKRQPLKLRTNNTTFNLDSHTQILTQFECLSAVSYTHLDVYKRQLQYIGHVYIDEKTSMKREKISYSSVNNTLKSKAFTAPINAALFGLGPLMLLITDFRPRLWMPSLVHKTIHQTDTMIVILCYSTVVD